MSIRLGLIGLGNWGGRLARAVTQVEGAHLAACFARDSTRRTTFADAHGSVAADSVDELVAGVDGVLVATPHSTHAALVEHIAGAGRAVMVEKPLALNVADARRCIDAVAKNGSILQVAHYRRRAPATRAVRDLITSGELGIPHLFEGHFTRVMNPDPSRPWRESGDEAPAGGMTALGVHMVDNLLYLSGEKATRVTALSTRVSGLTALDDMTAAVIEFRSGALATLTTSLRVPKRITCSAHGTKMIAWSEADGTRCFTLHDGQQHRSEVPVPALDPMVDNVAHFVECVRTGARPETGGAEGLAVVEILEAIVASAARGGAAVNLVAKSEI